MHGSFMHTTNGPLPRPLKTTTNTTTARQSQTTDNVITGEIVRKNYIGYRDWETSDKGIVTNAGMGVGSTGTTAILSTLQVEGSLGLQTNSPGSSTTLTAANNVLVFLGSSNATFTLPTASTVDGRVYWIMNHSAASTVTLSQSVTKANGSTFTVINPGQTALIIAVTGNGWRGSLWTSE